MKNILCYGDSNTYGYNADNGGRFPREIRWTGVLQKELGDDYYIIEEGLGGRTTVWQDNALGILSGAEYLYSCLSSHKPLDMVIVMLGTNDLKHIFSASALESSWGLERVVNIILKSDSRIYGPAPEVFIVSPPLIESLSADFKFMFLGASEKSQMIGTLYRTLAKDYSLLFLDAAEIVKTCKEDGVHLDAENHKKLGIKIASMIKAYYDTRN